MRSWHHVADLALAFRGALRLKGRINVMANPGTLAGTFVEPRGTIMSVVSGTLPRNVGGPLEQAAESQMETSSPLPAGSIGYLGITADQAIVFHAKRGLFSPRTTDQVVATAPRSEVVSATLEGVRLGSVLILAFRNGATWSFDIPRIHKKGAQAIVAVLTGHPVS
jgi:hypothetical protein